MSFVADLIRANPGTISLGQGVVHYPPPEAVLQSMMEQLRDPKQHLYGSTFGSDELRDKIRTKLAVDNGIILGRNSDVVVTAGSNMAFAHTILAITDPGDEVILLAPYYFNHEMAAGIASARPVIVPTTDSYEPDLRAIERAVTDRTRAIVTISPNNPTGVVYKESTQRAVNDLCRTRRIYHISDEAYEYFTFDGARHFSPGSISGAGAYTISLFSLSKAYGMASWRIGYMATPKILLPALRKIQDTIPICPAVPSQLVAVGALEAGPAYSRQFLGPLADVRNYVLKTLNDIGPRVHVASSRGAFYVFLRIDTDLDAITLTTRLIEDFRVAVIPGSTFGLRDRCYLRIAYGALEEETVVEAISRVARGLREILSVH